MDDGAADRRSTTGNDIDVSPPEDSDVSEASGDEEQSEGSSISDEPRDDEGEAPSAPPRLPKSRKAPAWTDPDDASLEISLASSARLRKLRDAPEEDAVKGPEYERRLRRQFVKMNPTPEWAAAARRKRRRTEVDAGAHADADADVDVPTLEGLDALVTSSGGILGHKPRARLDPGVLSIERLRDANQAAQAEGEVTAAQFHPSPQLSMLLVASSDRRIRLFNVRVWLVLSLFLSRVLYNEHPFPHYCFYFCARPCTDIRKNRKSQVDGHTNSHLQTLHIPALPVTNAQFHPSGSSVLLTGHRPFYYTYDLQSGATTRSPRGLWGTTFVNNGDNNADLSMHVCAFNGGGDLLAVAGRRGYVHLVDWRSGSGQVVGNVKANNAGGVKALWWLPNGRELMTLGEDAEAYLWDVGTRRCVHRWKDDGGFGSRVLAGDRSGSYVAVG